MKQSGFTLIETLVAIGMIGIVTIAILGYYVFSTKAVNLARNTTIATNLAQGLIEEQLNLPYSSLTPTIGTKQIYSADINSPYKNFDKQINITLIDSNLNVSPIDVGLKKIDCYIYWDSDQNERNIEISTIIAHK